MAQLVEHNLAKVGVAGSSPVVRSIACKEPVSHRLFSYRWRSGQVVRQRPAKPLPPVRIRASPPGTVQGALPGRPVFNRKRESPPPPCLPHGTSAGSDGENPVLRPRRRFPVRPGDSSPRYRDRTQRWRRPPEEAAVPNGTLKPDWRRSSRSPPSRSRPNPAPGTLPIPHPNQRIEARRVSRFRNKAASRRPSPSRPKITGARSAAFSPECSGALSGPRKEPEHCAPRSDLTGRIGRPGRLAPREGAAGSLNLAMSRDSKTGHRDFPMTCVVRGGRYKI